MTPERHRIEALHSLFILKNLPAEQLRQDVPPGPGPFPQKMLNYNSNTMITENQQVLQSTIGAPGAAIAMPTDSFIDADDIDMISNPDYRLFIPDALIQSADMYGKKSMEIDASMNVPISFDMRGSGANTEQAGKRLTSHHMQIAGVTNINKNDFASNQLLETTVAGGPISSVKDEDALNQHWQELMHQQAPKPSARDRNNKGRNQDKLQPYDYFNQQDTLYSINENDLLGNNVYGQNQYAIDSNAQGLPGASQNLMIYSTLAAAYPYELEVTAALGNSPRKDQFEEEIKVALPIRTARDDRIEQARKLSINAAVNEGTDGNEDDEDSADNMADVDEKTIEQNPKPASIVIEESQTLAVMIKQASDDENVEIEDEDETQTKAFEARESQWNRKLSIKHSEEKRLRQIKSNLSEAIVRSFEEARNYHAQQNPQPLPLLAPIDENIAINVETEKQMHSEFFSNLTPPKTDEKIELEEVLNNDQDEIMKPLRSSNLGNSHQLGMGSSPQISNKMTPVPRNKMLESPGADAVQMLPNSNVKHNRQQSSFVQHESHLVTHNLNLMSTVKVTDLKMHLQPILADFDPAGPGLAAKIALQQRAPEEQIEVLLTHKFISGDDMSVLQWAREISPLKLQESSKQILHFVQLVAASHFVLGGQFDAAKLPTLSRLILNLHELDNIYAMKANEFNQKQSMKFIIINSTGRHRKAPSEFQSAKTIKRHEVPAAQIAQSRKPSMNLARSFLGPTINDPSRVLQKQERKNYREEDSLLMFESNMTPISLRSGVQKEFPRPSSSNAQQHSQVKSRLAQSRSTQNLCGKRPMSSLNQIGGATSSLKALIANEFEDKSEAPHIKGINISASSCSQARRRNSPIRTAEAGQITSIKQLLHGKVYQDGFVSSPSGSSLAQSSNKLAVHALVDPRSRQRSGLSRSFRNGQNNSSNSLDQNRVGMEGRAQLAFDYGRIEINERPNQAPQQQQEMMTFGAHAASMSILRPYEPPMVSKEARKKGVTSGMKLVQPMKKTDDINLDLTILIDASEDMRVGAENSHRIENHQSRRTAVFGHASNTIEGREVNPSAVFVDIDDLRREDGVLSPPNLGMDEHQPIKHRMIGEIQQFNELLEASQDNLARRVSGREQHHSKPGLGIGMHLRQKDPLGSIVLTSSQDSGRHQHHHPLQSISASSSHHEPKQ